VKSEEKKKKRKKKKKKKDPTWHLLALEFHSKGPTHSPSFFSFISLFKSEYSLEYTATTSKATRKNFIFFLAKNASVTENKKNLLIS
jgi:hypothetical protein